MAPEEQQFSGGFAGSAGNPMNPGIPAGGGAAAMHASLTKDISWKILFALLAVDIFAGGALAVFFKIMHPQIAPFTFTSELFLLFFGSLMLVLDIPVTIQNNLYLQVKDNIYKFMLFLTRFTGRGIWYMYLGTMVWAALWDQDESKILGFVMALFPIIAGGIAIGKGVRLSLSLEKVRKKVLEEQYIVNHPLSMEDFSRMCSDRGVIFDPQDLQYVVNGLSLTAKNDGQVDVKEMQAWLSTTSGGFLQLI
jgi:hypothetical protein